MYFQIWRGNKLCGRNNISSTVFILSEASVLSRALEHYNIKICVFRKIACIILISILIFYFLSRILWSQNGMQIYNDKCVDMFILRLCLLWSMICIIWQEDNIHVEWQVFSENVTIWNLPLLFNVEHVWCLTFFTK